MKPSNPIKRNAALAEVQDGAKEKDGKCSLMAFCQRVEEELDVELTCEKCPCRENDRRAAREVVREAVLLGFADLLQDSKAASKVLKLDGRGIRGGAR